MGFCKIKDVEPEDVESLIYLCIPPERKNDKFFIDGINVKVEWACKDYSVGNFHFFKKHGEIIVNYAFERFQQARINTEFTRLYVQFRHLNYLCFNLR